MTITLHRRHSTQYISHNINIFIDTVALIQHYKDVPLQNGNCCLRLHMYKRQYDL